MDDREVERSCLCRERQGDQQSAGSAFGPEEESYSQSEPRDSTQVSAPHKSRKMNKIKHFWPLPADPNLYLRTIRLKARIVFTLKGVIRLWWAFGVTHRP